MLHSNVPGSLSCVLTVYKVRVCLLHGLLPTLRGVKNNWRAVSEQPPGEPSLTRPGCTVVEQVRGGTKVLHMVQR